MIDAKQAAKIAVAYVADLYGPDELRHVLVEELELTEDEQRWLVTVGFERTDEVSAMELLAGERARRHFKKLEIESSNGTVRSMKIRSV